MATVFFVGATGCIGGSVLSALQRAYPDSAIKALARDPSLIGAFNTTDAPKVARVEAVKGSFADVDLIAQLTYESDFVINAADSDNADLREALLKGFKKRLSEGKPLGGLVHTSGALVFTEGQKDGKFNPDAKVWTDNEEDIRSLKETQVHGQFDVSLLKAQEEGYLSAFIICPTMVHGIGGGPLKRPSLAFKCFVSDAIQRKRAAYIGEGSALAGYVHVEDLVPLYLSAFQQLVEARGQKLQSNPYERYVIATRETFDYKTVLAWVAEKLHELGKVESPAPVSVLYDQMNPLLALVLSRSLWCRSERAHTLGWNPVHPTLQQTLSEDIRLSL